MPGSVSPARGLRRHGPSRASDSNERGVHADTVSPGYRKLSYLPPERRTPVRFGLESPSGYLFLSSHIHLRLFLPPVQGKQFVHARLLPTDTHRFQEALSFLLWA